MYSSRNQTQASGFPASCHVLSEEALAPLRSKRERRAHKGNFGHVLIIGGNFGMAGAVQLAAKAALRVGAGLVSIATREQHSYGIATPEIMCHGVTQAADLAGLLVRASVVVIGPGLGQDAWANALFQAALQTALPLLVDADGLNLLSQAPTQRKDWILTPHPGEAARLLCCSSSAIEQDRYSSVQQLQQRYGGCVVLKGAGSLVRTAAGKTYVSVAGNPGMASAGMGDVLSGVIAGLWAQQFAAEAAVCMGVLVHAMAGDLAAKQGERGLLASDVISELRTVVNPK